MAPGKASEASVPTLGRCFSEPTIRGHLFCAGHFANTVTFALGGSPTDRFHRGLNLSCRVRPVGGQGHTWQRRQN